MCFLYFKNIHFFPYMIILLYDLWGAKELGNFFKAHKV